MRSFLLFFRYFKVQVRAVNFFHLGEIVQRVGLRIEQQIEMKTILEIGDHANQGERPPLLKIIGKAENGGNEFPEKHQNGKSDDGRGGETYDRHERLCAGEKQSPDRFHEDPSF
jgi:hypothetical protein